MHVRWLISQKAATTNKTTRRVWEQKRNITHGRRRRTKTKAKVIESERVGDGIKYRSVMRKKHEFLDGKN